MSSINLQREAPATTDELPEGVSAEHRYYTTAREQAVSDAIADATTTDAGDLITGTLDDARLSADAQDAIALRHDAVTIGGANGLSLGGQQISLVLATGSSAGAMSAVDKATLDAATAANTLETLVRRDNVLGGISVGPISTLNVAGVPSLGVYCGIGGTVTVGNSGQIKANSTGLGFFNTAPIAKPSSGTDMRVALINLGLLNGGATPLNLNNGALTCGPINMGAGSLTGYSFFHTGAVFSLENGQGLRLGNSIGVRFASGAAYSSADAAVFQYSTTNTIKLVTGLNGSTRAHLQMGSLNATGPQYTGAPSSAPMDADIANNQISVYLDESGNNLKFRIRKSDGTYKTATLAMT
jgi:hypothetical protein